MRLKSDGQPAKKSDSELVWKGLHSKLDRLLADLAKTHNRIDDIGQALCTKIDKRTDRLLNVLDDASRPLAALRVRRGKRLAALEPKGSSAGS